MTLRTEERREFPLKRTIEVRIINQLEGEVGPWQSTSQDMLRKLHFGHPEGGGNYWLKKVMESTDEYVASKVDGVERHWRFIG